MNTGVGDPNQINSHGGKQALEGAKGKSCYMIFNLTQGIGRWLFLGVPITIGIHSQTSAASFIPLKHHYLSSPLLLSSGFFTLSQLSISCFINWPIFNKYLGLHRVVWNKGADQKWTAFFTIQIEAVLWTDACISSTHSLRPTSPISARNGRRQWDPQVMGGGKHQGYYTSPD